MLKHSRHDTIEGESLYSDILKGCNVQCGECLVSHGRNKSYYYVFVHAIEEHIYVNPVTFQETTEMCVGMTYCITTIVANVPHFQVRQHWLPVTECKIVPTPISMPEIPPKRVVEEYDDSNVSPFCLKDD